MCTDEDLNLLPGCCTAPQKRMGPKTQNVTVHWYIYSLYESVMISSIFYYNIDNSIYGNTIIVQFVIYNMILFRKKSLDFMA